MVVVSGYWYMGVCARVLISRVRQVKDKSVCVRSEEERYVHVFYMTQARRTPRKVGPAKPAS